MPIQIQGPTRPQLHDILTTGQIAPTRTVPLATTVGPAASGYLQLSYFVGDKTESISTVTTYTGSVAAGATPTLCRIGIYSVAADESLTLVASTVNDTALWASTFSAYAKPLSSTFNKVLGVRYACGLLCVTAATLPQFHGISYGATTIVNTLVSASPTNLNRVIGQTDLPTTVAAGGFNADRVAILFRMS